MNRYTKDAMTSASGKGAAVSPRTEESLKHSGPSTSTQASRWSTVKTSKAVGPAGKSSPRSSSPEEAPLLGFVDTHNHKESRESDRDSQKHSISLSHQPHTNPSSDRTQQSGSSSILVSFLLTVLCFILVAVAPVIFHFRDHDLAENQYCVDSVLFASNSLSFSTSYDTLYRLKNVLPIL